MSWFTFAIGLFLGTNIGLVAAALINASKQKEDV